MPERTVFEIFSEDAALQDLESSEDLAKKLNDLFPEDQIYRYTVCSQISFLIT